MPNCQADREVDELVVYKVQKRVAKKVMKDIHQQVNEIEQQIQTEKRMSFILPPFLLLLSGIIIFLIVYRIDIMGLLSGLFN